MTTTNPDTTDYGMFSEQGNLVVHTIVEDAADPDAAMEMLKELATKDPGNFGEATDTEVEDAVFCAVFDRVTADAIMTAFDVEQQQGWLDRINSSTTEPVSMHYDSIRDRERKLLGKIDDAMETIRRLHKDIAEYNAAIVALQDRIKPLKGK